jgi:hypothetical protein
MPRLFKILLVGFALGFELIFLGTYNPYPHGEMVDVHYRGHERLAAWFDYHQHPSPTSKATLDDEMRLMHRHEDWKGYVALGLIVVANVAGIYYFLRCENRNAVA